MGDDSKPPSFILATLLIISAYLAFAETSLASASKNKIKLAAERGDNRAVYAMKALENFDRAITTILICNNLVSVSIATLVTVFVTKKWGINYVTIGTVVTTIVIFFACEMLPKSIAKKQSYWVLLYCAGPLVFLMKIFKPLSFILTKIGDSVSKKQVKNTDVSVTEDELHDLIYDMEEEGALDSNQSSLMSSALEFGDLTCESILTPRVDVCAIDINEDPIEIRKFLSTQTHSRFPVYENNIDNIIGVLQIRKYMKAFVRSKKEPDLRKLLDKVHYAHQSTPIHELLPVMSKQKINMAVITDSYGGTLGIITVEDILEELVGEIWDESDVIEEPIVKISDNKYISDANVTVSDLFDFIGFENTEQQEDDFTNLLVGEWVYKHFTEIPKKGDSFLFGNLVISVASIEHNRILKVNVEVKEECSC